MSDINPQISNSELSNTAVGFFRSAQNAEDALRALHTAGFEHDQIGVAGHVDPKLAGQETKPPGFWHRTRTFFRGSEPAAAAPPPGPTAVGTVPPAAMPETSGSAAGAGSNETYAHNISDLHGTLTGLPLSVERSRYFADRLAGDPEGVLISVKAGSRKGEADEILKSFDADVGEDIEAVTAASAEALPRAGAEPSLREVENQPIQLYGEVLRVHRDRVQRGEARLRKEVVTETKSVDVPVTHEELVIERTPVNGEQPAPGAEIGKEEEIRIPLNEERVSVEKKPVVVEEIRAEKRQVTDVEKHNEELRREELKVENEKAAEAERLRKAS